MTENDEKVAEEYASTICGGIDGYYSKCKYCQNAKAAYLAGLAHERKRNEELKNENRSLWHHCADLASSIKSGYDIRGAYQRYKDWLNNKKSECICGEINARNCPVHQAEPTVDFGTFKARVEDL